MKLLEQVANRHARRAAEEPVIGWMGLLQLPRYGQASRR